MEKLKREASLALKKRSNSKLIAECHPLLLAVTEKGGQTVNEFQDLSGTEVVACGQLPDDSSGQNNWSFQCLPGCPEKSSDSGTGINSRKLCRVDHLSQDGNRRRKQPSAEAGAKPQTNGSASRGR